jgi:hypothetical protein
MCVALSVYPVFCLLHRKPKNCVEEENKLIEAGFEYVRYSSKEVAVYKERR